MDKESFILIGRIKKKTGFRGDLILSNGIDEPELYENLESVFIEIDGKRIPFFIEESDFRTKDSVLFRLKDLRENHLELLKGCEVFILKEQWEEEKGKEDYPVTDFKGFSVIDKEHGELGIVEDLIQSPAHPVLVIPSGSKDILIPLTEAFIENIDTRQKILYVDTPDGLIDLNL